MDNIPQMAIRDVVITMTLGEMILRKLQEDRYQYQQLLDNVLSNLPLELLDLGSMLVDQIWMRAFQFRDVFEDIVHLDLVSAGKVSTATKAG
jgi:hypothetical protein